AAHVGQKPRPSPRLMLTGRTSAISANDGIARPMLATATESTGKRRVCAKATAGGIANAAARTVATIEIHRWARPRAQMPADPCQLADVVRNDHVSPIASSIRRAFAARE